MKNNNIFNVFYKIIIRLILAISCAVSVISICTVAVLNSTWLYEIAINKYNLTKITGLSSNDLMDNYKELIVYLQNIFVDKLIFKDFAMSKYGEIHFQEVKNIFLYIIAIALTAIIGLALYFIIFRNNIKVKEKLIRSLNDSANLLIGFFISITAVYFIDFSWAFTIFHKIFFRNDYWIFDPKLDPVINALPEEFFMICAATILILLLVAIVVIKVLFNRKQNVAKIHSGNTVGI